MRSFRTLLPCVVLILAACGGADERDTDRTSLASRAPHDVMLSDTTAFMVTDSSAKPNGPVSGAEVFTKCAACHQSNGMGTPGAWPPLAGSEWLVNNPGVPIRIVLHGLHGAITVKGQSFNNSMQAWAEQLSDDEIAAVLTYERSNWGNAASAITAEQVKAVRDSTKEHTQAWTADELKPLLGK